ncbi:Deoxyribodipyrimidine photo-lyase [Chloroherpeton thalassium ATCC 35110]|uniref:Deoxyribodipyrimidine photo-lyase n=1 Tax=Chloroherpeton thalassium (strain ATCC 35110 / GB-78) TaxID=517418 RepID=B3QX58_CHLT3|nr:deoxyribodipyrimidine photo-lyase [Chloroherpeton thalassium]ACF14868.1 Deoxyribodipyrimidine photo-lyase [Chloroherpeton thalassium ATCC 35110]
MNRIIVWHRRDLRIFDHSALAEAAKFADEIIPIFILDDDILLRREDFSPACVGFMLESLEALALSYANIGGKLIVRRGQVLEVLKSLVGETRAQAIYFNEDYEPFAKMRDQAVQSEFEKLGVRVKAFTDQVCFHPQRVLKDNGQPYTVFTPYQKKWLALSGNIPTPQPALTRISTPELPSIPLPKTSDIRKKFSVQPIVQGGEPKGLKRLRAFLSQNIYHYKELRDFPATNATSLLSADLRFGTLSIRHVFHESMRLVPQASEPAREGIQTFISELIWREFYFQILDHFPHVEKHSFKPEFENLKWENNEVFFEAWKNGQTGYPIVDAAMRALRQTGWMHNRLRMIVASFLTKDLLIDWRWGELYFMQHLIDGDLAANNGGWQWSASTGTDAQPYFRIFNPVLQSQKFDPKGEFIRKYVPELQAVPVRYIHFPAEILRKSPLLAREIGVALGKDYPHPIVEHKVQREKALRLYKAMP